MSDSRVSYGVMPVRLFLTFALLALPVAGIAAPPALPNTTTTHVRNGGTLDGKITTIDYQRSMLGLDASGRGHIEVSVMPSTSIQGPDSGYHAFTDLKPGERVQIFSSVADGKYVAQIIRIR